jgi:hypothetical protein
MGESIQVAVEHNVGQAVSAEASDLARALAARRRRITSACRICGREYTGVVTRLYCSAACRLRASRARRREVA